MVLLLLVRIGDLSEFFDVPFPLCDFCLVAVVLIGDDELLLFVFLLLGGLVEDLLELYDSSFVCLLVFDEVRVILFGGCVDVFIMLSCLL